MMPRGPFSVVVRRGGNFTRSWPRQVPCSTFVSSGLRLPRNIYPDFSLDLHLKGGFEEYIRGVQGLFPEEQRGLKDYFALMRRIGGEISRFEEITWWRAILFPFYFRHLIRYQRTSLGPILDRYFQGDGIKRVLSSLPGPSPPLSSLHSLYRDPYQQGPHQWGMVSAGGDGGHLAGIGCRLC